MSLIKPTIFIDLISTFWVTIITMIFLIWLPMSGVKVRGDLKVDFAGLNSPNYRVELLGLWLRNICSILMGVLILGHFNLLNWLTLTAVYCIFIFINNLKTYGWKINFVRENIQNKVINLVDFLDRGLSFTEAIKRAINKSGKTEQILSDRVTDLVSRRGIVFFIFLVAVLGFTLLLRWEYPLAQLRFSHPDNYHSLLVTRQLLAKNYPELNYIPVFSALGAIVSLLGSIEPMQTIRFLSPLVGILLVISTGYVICIFTNNIYSALVGMFALGVYLFTIEINSLNIEWLNRIIESLNNSLVRQWTGSELELGAIFLLLGLAYCFNSNLTQQKTLAFQVNLLCSILLVAISAPPLLIIFAIASIGLIGDKQLTLTAIVLTWIILAVFAAMSQGELLWLQSFLKTLPVALSLLAGLLFTVISDTFKIFIPQWSEIFCLGIVFSLSINFLLPLPPNLTYVEYDMAARKSLEIKNLFSPQNWTLVAPVEQLAEIYGAGWYQDLALFVEQYGDKAKKAGFDFPVSGDDLFIMVEKIPFVTFPNEPDTLPHNVLSDRTYQYYRSSAGRASLEYEALKMCEAYARYHRNSSIYYEDRELRIYHFII
ncbi:hypothetical protein I4641_19580 [Waterburya agarophytonicola K14]|uniref:Uncharacterized protein n=1 Tax=Waterburya agarophytonicola KI4 TaxID=2874699 RepID=A0A964FGQ7_9CYAN|nr:hypothetical protein [Waterburya agarophytonicola]MCC0179170.1 hypothetical protein [Waterburya agarophytonicola KI4]